MTDKPQDAPQNPNPDYQDRDILVKPIVYFLIGLTVLTVAVLIAMGVLFRMLDRQAHLADAHIPAAARERVLPPEPRLVVDEKMALDEYLANARRILEGYALLDEETGRVRIPIDEAIDRVAERGLPRWAAPEREALPAEPDGPELEDVLEEGIAPSDE